MIAVWTQVGFMLAGIIGYVLLWFNVCPELAQALIPIFLLNISFILSIIPHELGHAIAASLLGLRVFNVVFGSGKQAFKFYLFRTIFSFHWLPFGGLTRFAPKSIRWYRVKFLAVILAGPAANAIIALTILYISQHRGGVPVPAQLFLIANAVVFVSNLIPRHYKSRNLDSDGLQIIGVFLKSWKKKEQSHVEARFLEEAAIRRDENGDIDGAAEWCKKGLALYPENVQLLNMTALLCLDRGNYAQARELYTQLLQRKSKLPGWRYILLNNIAYADALTGDPSLLPEAEAYSEEAYRNLPWADFVIGTRGTVLVEMGKHEEGIRLLKESIERCKDPRNNGLNACHLSIAYARMGDYEQANEYLKLASLLAPRSSLLERAATELRKQQQQHPVSGAVPM